MHTTIGQLLVNDALPDDLRDHDRVLDKNGIGELLAQVAEKYPDQYRDVAKRLSDVGHEAAFTTGGYSFGLKSLRASLAARKMRMELGAQLRTLYANRSLTDDDRDNQVVDLATKRQKQLMDDVFEEAKGQNHPLAMQAVSGARGSKVNVNSLLGADMLYVDHRDRPIPIPVLRSYSQGLRPVEYFAGAFGARKGVMDLKNSTRDAGFLAKQLSQVAHRLLVSSQDDDNPYDDTNPRGMPNDTLDPDNEGALLAHAAGGYPRNTELTPKILKDLHGRGLKQILVRSPIVGGPEDGGVYARDVGRRERGGLPPIGDMVGIAAAQALSEPITQASISSKHSGGIAGASAGAIGGFQAINSLIQVPKTFRNGASHAQLDGRVSEVREAPQGGNYVRIGSKEHYVPHSLAVTVKAGDEVEAGDTLSEGVPNPAEIVRYKGVGAGRRYFVDAFRKTLKDSGVYGHRRNIELLSRGLINHVRLTDELDDWAPDDVVPYQTLERNWQPRVGTEMLSPASAMGRYLERPILHHTIGTKVRPSMLKQFSDHGVQQLSVHQEPPPFEPEMIRGMQNVHHDPDWMSRMLGSYQKDSLLDATHRGAVSDEAGSSYVPALARGENYGKLGLTKGWTAPKPVGSP